MPTATSFPGILVHDEVVAAGKPWSRVVKRGEVLRIVDLEGTQAVDFLCYSAADPAERYNAADTMKVGGKIFIEKGSVIYSGLGNAMLTVIEDTCGFHDTIGGCCSAEANRLRYGVWPSPNCRDNFLEAIRPFGLDRRDIVANINFFMYVPVGQDGQMAIVDGRSKPGDFVDLRAEMDLIVAISNCPQMNNPCNGYRPTPIRTTIWRPAAAA
ncbi:MAG: urea amidolyase associated protein UAAP1 [Alphaproteobacteria bacterium]